MSILLLAAFLLVVVRNAWIGDDAYITLRTVRSFVAGDGLVWNPGERVQVYTHPLWIFVLSFGHLLTGEAFWSTLVLCTLASGAAAWLLAFRVARTPAAAFAALAALLSSIAFVDYSTSGLENSLNHLLVFIFVLHVARVPAKGSELRHLRNAMLLAMVITLTRLDVVLLVAPAVALLTWNALRRDRLPVGAVARALVLGATPLIAWEAFGLLYYGLLVPNTALAKLRTGIPPGELAQQGLFYLYSSLSSDPVTLVLIVCALVFAAVSRNAPLRALGAGIVLYLAYLVRIGGDFMNGRFLTVPYALAVAMLAYWLPLSWRRATAAAFAIAWVGLVAPAARQGPFPSMGNPSLEGRIDVRGIADERSYYATSSGLAGLRRSPDLPSHPGRYLGERMAPGSVHVEMTVGYSGYFSPRSVYLIDALGLTDPLLARLPARHDPEWRIGHFVRGVPEGYVESVRSGENRFADPALGELWRAVRCVTHDPLFSRERLRTIWRLNTGAIATDLDPTRYRYAGEQVVDLAALASDAPGEPALREMIPTGVRVELGTRRHDATLAVELGIGASYDVAFFDGPRELGRRHAPYGPGLGPLRRVVVDVPSAAADVGYTHVRILPHEGPAPFCMGTLVLSPAAQVTRAPGSGH